ncbi:hypothetical protein [Bacillus marasmi]|uniref:hypothetical protein n=1 Tax=Bacillus marasmi TaxID=1926279 RepID=UPI0011CC5477|nr:hypothetical protein [Bacillus marasmi]
MQGSLKFKVPILNKADEFDNSNTIMENTEYLKDGRPIITQVWKEDEYTFITYFIPSLGIEEMQQNQLLNYLIQQGIKMPPDFNELRVSTIKFNDMLNMECWSITIVVSGLNH